MGRATGGRRAWRRVGSEDRGRPMTGIGIVGAGVILAQYRETLSHVPGIRVVAVADLDPGRTADAAALFPGARPATPDDLYADPAIDVVLNLTIPAAHADVALAALAAGKDVYGEKPLAATLDQARKVTAAAAAAGRRVGCAPDTVLGTGVQTARTVIAEGRIGRPVSATASVISAGHESWHPNPDFYYLPGGGPVFDMGPYHLTALVHLLGPVAWVHAAGSRSRTTRTIGSGARAGERIPVEVDTHVTGVLGHVSGALSTVTFSFDAVATRAAPIEVHGTEGAMSVPDPNTFDGDVLVRGRDGDEWMPVPVAAGYEQAGRGIGLVDALAGARRASGDLALHVLEIMTALTEGSPHRVDISSAPDAPPLVPFTPADAWRMIAEQP